MNVLDENITRDQADLLSQWGIRSRSISRDFRCQGMQDDNILPFLLRLSEPTLLTRDGDFFERGLVHARYCLAWFNVDAGTSAQRLGKVVCIAPRGIEYWLKGAERLTQVRWP